MMHSQDWLNYYRELSKSLFTVVDVETTGSQPEQDRVIEVSVLQGKLGQGVLLQETYLINPGVPLSLYIQSFTGITPAMLADAPSPLSVWTKCLPLLSVGTLTAHNLQFDYGFLRQEYARLGVNFVCPSQLCTLRLSRLLLADLPSRSLPHLVKYFQFPITTSHRAAADTLACWLLLEKLLQRILQHPEEFLAILARQWLTAAEVGAILQIPPAEVETYLKGRSVRQHYSRHRQATVYLRADVELLHPCQSGNFG